MVIREMVQQRRKASASEGDNLILAIDLQYLSDFKDTKWRVLPKEALPNRV